MNPFLLYTQYFGPLGSWSRVAWRTAETFLAAGQVITQRSNMMLSAGRSPSGRAGQEFTLMGQEKIAAAAESSQAMTLHWVRLNQQVGAIAFRQMQIAMAAMMSLAASRSPERSMAVQNKLLSDTTTHSLVATSRLSKSAARIASRGLKPIHSRATGNAKRLAKR